MEDWKLDYFRRDFPQIELSITKLEPVECESIASSWRRALGLHKSSSGQEILLKALSLSESMVGVNAESEDFKFLEVLSSQGIHPGHAVFVNWYQFNRIDKVVTEELGRYFDYFWYPSSDDIEVFDASFNWMIFVLHHGGVNLLKI